jgi:hypothetical protein
MESLHGKSYCGRCKESRKTDGKVDSWAAFFSRTSKKGVADFVSRKLGGGKVSRNNIVAIPYTSMADEQQDRKHDRATKGHSSNEGEMEPWLLQGNNDKDESNNNDDSGKLPADTHASTSQQQSKRLKLRLSKTPVFAKEQQHSGTRSAEKKSEPFEQSDTSGDNSPDSSENNNSGHLMLSTMAKEREAMPFRQGHNARGNDTTTSENESGPIRPTNDTKANDTTTNDPCSPPACFSEADSTSENNNSDHVMNNSILVVSLPECCRASGILVRQSNLT